MTQTPGDRAMQSAATPAASSGQVDDAMQTAGHTALPSTNEVLMPTTVASASVMAPPTAGAKKQPPPLGGYAKRSCQGSSESMVAHQGSTTNEQARLNDVAEFDTGNAAAAAASSFVARQQQPGDDAHYMCSTCHVPLINRDTNQGQLYQPLPKSHELLTMRQIIHAALHNPTRIRHMVPVCYCCLTNMMMKAYLDLLAIQRDTQGAIAESAILYGIDRQAPP